MSVNKTPLVAVINMDTYTYKKTLIFTKIIKSNCGRKSMEQITRITAHTSVCVCVLTSNRQVTVVLKVKKSQPCSTRQRRRVLISLS